MKLQNKKVAIVATNGFEESELFEPLQRLKDEGATVDIISIEKGEIVGKHGAENGKSIQVDKTFGEVKPEDYNALVLPGGLANPDTLRQNKDAVAFVKHFGEVNKPIAAICHGPWTMINAEIVKGKKMTSYPSLEVDLRNAGVNWVDEEVVVDQGMVTSRTPDDLPAFNDKMVEEIAEGKH
ncbi:DJ-1/PfpI/YhbO family deglycase/protease [Flavobacteriaceae bacterium Ap0902]|nr:DJ-1/PfpI/YhbO family deglycase/protease [Flavobacteriaceae bacterium Ap0902]